MAGLFALLFGLFKLGKVGGTAITMLVSLAVYAGLYGWRFAAGFIGLIFVHEMGHFVAARQRGLAVGAPVFIPFVGAWIALREQPMSVETEAYVAMAGPFVGTVGAAAVYFWARDAQDPTLLAIAYSGFFLNFFNLIPLSPLDGGRITAILSPRVWLIGAPILVAMMIYRPSPVLLVIGIAALPSLAKAWHYDRSAPENLAYYGVPTSMKVEYGLLYLGLAAFLAFMTDATRALLSNAS